MYEVRYVNFSCVYLYDMCWNLCFGNDVYIILQDVCFDSVSNQANRMNIFWGTIEGLCRFQMFIFVTLQFVDAFFCPERYLMVDAPGVRLYIGIEDHQYLKT